MKLIREAQRKACQRKEWKGRVSFVKTTEFARPKEESPNVGHGHHWFGNAESYFLIGDALGKEMVPLVLFPAAALDISACPACRATCIFFIITSCTFC